MRSRHFRETRMLRTTTTVLSAESMFLSPAPTLMTPSSLPRNILLIALVFSFAPYVFAQKRTSAARPKPSAVKSPEIGQSAIVIDETLAVLRKTPSLFSASVHRMSRGRRVQIQGAAEGDGVKFYKVIVPPTNFGWVQADAVFGKFRPVDEKRLADLVQAADGFEQIEIAGEFFKLYPDSRFKPSLLLLYGDLLEEIASVLSRNANSRLSRKEMAASGAPLHSYYLNFNMLDRYRKLGVIYTFNSATKLFHYNGSSWNEIVSMFPGSSEAVEAQKRLDTLKQKMEKR